MTVKGEINEYNFASTRNSIYFHHLVIDSMLGQWYAVNQYSSPNLASASFSIFVNPVSHNFPVRLSGVNTLCQASLSSRHIFDFFSSCYYFFLISSWCCDNRDISSSSLVVQFLSRGRTTVDVLCDTYPVREDLPSKKHLSISVETRLILVGNESFLYF